MEHRAFQITESRELRRRPEGDLSALSPLDEPHIWIDINQRDPVALAEFLSALNLHPLAVEACLERVPSSGVGAYGRSLFVHFPALAAWDDMKGTSLSILCLPGAILTLHEGPIPALDGIVEQFTSGMRFHTLGTSAVLFQILDHIIDQDMAFASEARGQVDHLEERVDQEADAEITDEIQSLKRKASHLTATFEDQLHSASALQTIESDAFSVEGLKDYFRDAAAHLEHAVRSVGRQTDRLTAIQQHYLLTLQDQTNQRLWILTIVSVIFLPLTLVTGIYGMNFRYMPELNWRYGYFGVLLGMLAVALGAVWYFFRKEWFK